MEVNIYFKLIDEYDIDDIVIAHKNLNKYNYNVDTNHNILSINNKTTQEVGSGRISSKSNNILIINKLEINDNAAMTSKRSSKNLSKIKSY